MTAILHATELAHFASMAAFVGFAVTLFFGSFIRFAPARRHAISDSGHQAEAVDTAAPPKTQHPSRN
jgi:F0F1-type ATP synthase membrane subunit b/b'